MPELKYLPIFQDMEEIFEPYTAEERGNLITALMEYAFHGILPTFTGNERYIWSTLKRSVDQCAASIEKQKANGAKGGRPSSSSAEEKPKKTQPKPKKTQAKPNETQNNHKQEQEQLHIQEQYQVVEEEKEEERTTTAATADRMFFGDELTQEDVTNANAAESLIMRYNIPNGGYATVSTIAGWIKEHGIKRVDDVISQAAQANTRDRLSLNFIAAFFRDKPKPGRVQHTATGDVMSRHQYTAQDYKDMVIDLDEVDGF